MAVSARPRATSPKEGAAPEMGAARCLAAVYAKGETALLQAPDEAFAGGTALLVPLKDAGVLEHVAEDDADLLV